MPKYTRARYGGESVTLDNGLLRLEMHKRLTGWGWGEIYAPDGKLMAILDHLGEVKLRDQDIPMRLEADACERDDTPEGERLRFRVKALVVRDKLKGTSFEGWMRYMLDDSCVVGEASLTLLRNAPVVKMSLRLVSRINGFASYVRGPWLKPGQDSFGLRKDDAMLPGVEWAIGEEWTSGTDWFKDPWALRVAPHPNKATAPVMALSHGGEYVALRWNPNQCVTGWFNYRRHVPQPVFAAPNFVDRQNCALMGLMVPCARDDEHENRIEAEHPLELHLDQRVDFDAEIVIGHGSSLDALVDWVKANGLPEPDCDLGEMESRLHRIANAYATRFFFEGRGFGTKQSPEHIAPNAPPFAKAYLQKYPDAPEARALKARVEWCEAQTPACEPTREELAARAETVLSWQKADGSFAFEPEGRHYRKDDFVVASGFIEPMGHAGDTALDIVMLPALELMELGGKLGDQRLLDAARKALDYCLPMTRPEAGDFWECPLHSPNLFASGHAANAYETGYRVFGDERYRAAAIHWIRGLLAFTHLWSPKDKPMLYNTKPCLCSSDWYFANWVRDHVQWEVLETFAQADELGIAWADVDAEIDWDRFRMGVTSAAMRWMSDHTRDDWRPHNMPWTLDDYRSGAFDDCYPDTHNPVTGNYGGAMIPPERIAANLMGILARAGK